MSKHKRKNPMKTNQLQNLSIASKQYNDKRSSLFFTEIFNSIKNTSNNDEKNKQIAREKFDSLKGYLFNLNDFKNFQKQKNNDLLGIILSTIKERSVLTKEFNFLKEYFHKTDVDTAEVENKMFLLASKYKIQSTLVALSFFLKQFPKCYRKTDFSDMLIQKSNELDKSREIDFVMIEDISSQLKSIDIDIENQKDFIKILLEIRGRDDFFKFLENKTDNDFRNLPEFAGEVDDNTATANDIQDLINVVNFVNDLKGIRNVTDKEFITQYNNLFNEHRYSNIAVNFSQVIKNFFSLKDLYLKVTNKSLIYKNVIKDLIKESKFDITKKNNVCVCKVKYSKEGKDNEFTLDQVQVFKNNVLLKQKDKDDEAEEDPFSKQCIQFSTNIYQIGNIIDLVNELYIMGDIVNYMIKCIILDNQVSVITDGDCNHIEDVIQKLKERKDTIYKEQKKQYKNDILNTFIYGKLNVLLRDYLPNQNQKNPKVENLLKYITQNNYKNKLINFNEEFSVRDYSESKEVFYKFLKQVTNENNLTIQKIFSNSTLKNPNSAGIYSCLVTNVDTDQEIIDIVYELTEKYPMPHTFLFCNEDTSYEEVIAFIYRALFCEYNVLFCIFNIDVIDVVNKNSIITEMNEIFSFFFRENRTIRSCLMFLYTYDAEIIREVKKSPGHRFYNKNKLNKQVKKGVKIVSSQKAGAGKSMYIQGIAMKNKKNHIYFPIGGEIKRDEIIERLLALNIDDNVLIHLDLQDTSKDDKIALMKDFLFNFLILGYYSKDDTVFYISNTIEIIIEIPNCFYSFLDKFPILKLFEIETITEANRPKLIADSNLLSNIQIACNYLKLLPTIDKEMPYFPGLTIKEFEDDNIYKDATVLSSEECEKLLKPYIDGFNYFQINTFINSFSSQMRYFNKNIYFSMSNLKYGTTQLKTIRYFMVYSSIKLTNHFTKGAYSNLLSNQMKFYKKYTAAHDEGEATEKAIENLCQTEPVSFDDIKPSLVFFNEDGQALSIISTCKPNSEEWNELTNLLNCQNKGAQESLTNYKTLDRRGFLDKIKRVLSLNNAIDIKEKTEKVNNKIMQALPSIDEIVDTYAFTSDNFIKMINILLRIRAKTPVILMGETGCGKTSLIKMISKLKKNNLMITFDIHAGITDKEIIEMLQHYGLLEGYENNLSNIAPNAYDLMHKCKKKGEEFIVWLFLDQINTCNSMGLLTELMTKKTVQGKKVLDFVVFIGACNPYKMRIQNREEEEVGLRSKDHKIRKLVYTVNPLPQSLLNFVFDFGHLKSEDEQKYIHSMIKQKIEELFGENKNSDTCKSLLEKGAKAIFAAQDYIRKTNDESAVSLREVRRVVVFLEAFYKYLRLKKDNNLIPEGRRAEIASWDSNEYIEKALSLSIYLCYFLRIPSKRSRKELENIIKKYFIYFTNLADKEMDEFAKRISVDKGTALNRALKENLFTLFFGITNKIPVFIVGKPGCSKSLSVQLLYQSMKGESSEDPLFRYFPRIILTSYQGSKTSTSQGIEFVFDKAKKIALDQKGKEAVISMVYFDELGLAELSKNNPLKVLHKLLEYDETEKDEKVAFVGISNWILDASKMNRGLFLSITDPDKIDLEETAKTIANSYQDNLSGLHPTLFKNLADTYYDYKKYLSLNSNNNREFHGSRDFYHMIKVAARLVINNPEMPNPGIPSLQRNLGGLDKMMEVVKNIYNGYGVQKANNNSVGQYDIMKCIKDNINDPKSRYLLVISKSSLSPFLISNILDNENCKKEYLFYQGSQFRGDCEKDVYAAEMLSKVQRCMEEGKLLMLQHFDFIYPSLYDLFNQNFTVVSGKSYARIALGTSNNAMSLVHDNFRCIILVDDKAIDNQDSPFLNRFEKHILSFDNLIEASHISKFKNFKETFDPFFSVKEADKKKNMFDDIEKQKINCDDEEIKAIIYQIILKDPLKEKIEKEIFENIVPTLSQDLIFFINSVSCKYVLRELINQTYFTLHNNSLEDYLQFTDNYKNLIFTFTNCVTQIKINPVNNAHFNQLSKITSIYVNEINSDKNFEKRLNDFYRSEASILIVRFKPCDCLHLNHIRITIDNFEKTHNYPKKVIILLVHLIRFIKKPKPINNTLSNKKEKDIEKSNEETEYTLDNSQLISHLSNYNQIFIDDLFGRNNLAKKILQNNNKNFLDGNEELLNCEELIKENLYQILTSSFDIDVINGGEDPIENEIASKLLSKEFADVREEIIKCIKKQFPNKKDLLEQIFFNNINYFDKESSFVSIIQRYCEHFFISVFEKILFKSLSDSILSIVLLDDNSIMNSKAQYKKYLSTIDLSKVKLNNGIKTNKITIIKGLIIPHSNIHFEKVKQVAAQYSEKFYQCENHYKESKLIGDALIPEKKIYDETIAKSSENVYNEMSKIEYFKNYLTQEAFVPLFLSDYLKVFLSSKFKSNLKNLSELIQILICLRFDEINSYKDLAKVILFLEGYDSYIFNMCHIYEIIEKHFDIKEHPEGLIETVNNAIKDGEIQLPEYNDQKNLITLPFFKVTEGLLIQVMEQTKLFSFEDQNIYEFKDIINYANDIELNLNLLSRELFTLKNFNDTYNLLSKTGKESLDNIKQYLALIQEERNENDTTIISEIIQRQFTFLKSKVGKIDNNGDILISIIISKFQQYQASNIHLELIKLVIEDNNLIIHSKKLLQYLLPKTLILPKEGDTLLETIEGNKVGNLSVLTEINSNKSTLLGDIMLNYFEIIYYFFFENIKRELNNDIEMYNELIRSKNEKYFQQAIDHLHKSFIEQKEEKKDNNLDNIKKYMSIAYIKCYLSNLVDIIMDPTLLQKLGSVEEIINGDVKKHGDSKEAKTIQIYILKLIYQKCGSYENFKMNKFEDQKIGWIDEFPRESKCKAEIDFSFVNLEQYKLYKTLFDSGYATNFGKDNIENKATTIITNGLFNYFDLMYNTVISNHINPNYKDDNNYINYLTFGQELLKFLQINKETRDIFSFFIQPEKLGIGNLKNEFEMFMIGLKLTLSCTLANENSFYKKLVSYNIENTLKDSFIPGGEPENKKLFDSYLMIKNFLNTQGPTDGAYICCDQYYFFDPCGYPNQRHTCPVCKKPTNIKRHILEKRQDANGNYTNYRIYKNEEFRKESEKIYWVHNEDTIPFKYFRDFEEMVNKEKEKHLRGINNPEANLNLAFFRNGTKETRTLSQVAYRLLSFVLYCSIYYSSKANYITKEKLEPLLIDKKDPILMIRENWKQLKSLLLKRRVDNIIIFMNMIFPKLSELIKNSTSMSQKDERIAFETTINTFVTNSIDEYLQYKPQYEQKNREILQTDPNSIQSFVKESYSPDFYSKDDYPFYEFFMIPSYPKIEELKEIMEIEKEKYPVLNALFIVNEQDIAKGITCLNNIQNKLRYLKDINSFANRMMDQYSYAITRKEAKTKKIEDELMNMNEENLNEEYRLFENAWNELKYETTQYQCRNMAVEHTLSKKDSLAYILNDDGEIGYGMHLASMYENFIKYQNEFLSRILNHISDQSILKFYKSSIEKKIIVQEASEKEIVSITQSDLESLLINYTKRNCYDQDGRILYTNYKMIHYDLELLNDYCGHLVLQGKRLFEINQRFVVYCNEAYSGTRSSMLIDFISKYQQEKMNKETKDIMINSLKDKNENDSILFMLSLQCLMCYLLKQNFEGKETIEDIVNGLPMYVNIKESFKIFVSNRNEFKLDNILELYQYIEMKTFKVIIDNLPITYKEELNQNQKDKIKKYFTEKKELLITKEILQIALMRFIIRYLSGTRQDIDIKNEEDLIIRLQYREDIWDKEVMNNEKFDDEIYEIMNFSIKVSNCVSFYNTLK